MSSTVLAVARAFRSVKRRMEVIGDARGITVYDDFAHHPTAIATTLAGLRARVGDARIVVAMEPRSNSMRLGAHADALAPSLDGADVVVFLHRPELQWDAGKVVAGLRGEGVTAPDVDALIAALRTPCARATTWCSCRTGDSTARRGVSSRPQAAEQLECRARPSCDAIAATLGLFPLAQRAVAGRRACRCACSNAATSTSCANARAKRAASASA